MDMKIRAQILQLLESSQERNRKIALLHYELNHSAQTSGREMIEAMALGHGESSGHIGGRISDKTFYIALNYQNKVHKLNTDLKNEIVDQLIELEEEQERLEYYVSLLVKRQAAIIRLFYFQGLSQDEIAKELEIVPRTVRRIRDEAVDKLVELYSFTKKLTK